MMAKEDLHSLLDVGRSTVTKDDKKAEIFNAALPQSLIARPDVLWVHSPLSWNTGTGCRMKSP